MSLSDRSLKRLLWWLLRGSRGGFIRAKTIETLKETPCNVNQIAKVLEVSWGTMKHHIRVLEENGLITHEGDGYGKTYFLSSEIEEKYVMFEDIMAAQDLKKKR